MAQLDKSLHFEKFKDDQHRAVVAVWYAGILIDEMAGKTLAPFNISVEQFRIMRVLQSIYPATIPVYNIVHYMHVRSDISRAITQLSQRGLVEKLTTEEDKRQVPVKLSEEGLELMNNAMDKLHSQLFSLPAFAPEVAGNTARIVEQMIKAFEKELRKNLHL